ncbi:hypothetical protein [Salegentibacter salegens]|uniref:Uncharacterized protein n=1 Tax=Salegentibacter salegens TaxID=143223 RepID=A0A1M7KV85_9FLAO|nr:hypothetical protein [Salegentibacter salegens]PRX43819.1 hypothetical protein LY58_02230 [Salegentibacter salegens]SHM69290.1 hypothetical protein SAMN05878281_1615 [Salegentibacter salegens]
MRKAWFILFLINLFLATIQAQERDTLPKLDLGKLALVNQSDSYITFPIDIGNIEPLMFEANLNPNFVIRERKDSRLMAVLTPQITIRMYNKESYPVQTPSYIPQISFYYLSGDPNGLNQNTYYGRIAHYSNGQDGAFYRDSLKINVTNGNFATNYMEFGLIRTSYSQNKNAVKFFKSSLEVHPKTWMIEELRGHYSGLRWHNSFFAYKLPLDSNIFSKTRRANFSVKIETTLMLDQINYWELLDADRINAALTFYYHPKFLEDIGFFVQFYHGMDYYNIYFRQQLSVIRFGLMTEILRF